MIILVSNFFYYLKKMAISFVSILVQLLMIMKKSGTIPRSYPIISSINDDQYEKVMSYNNIANHIV